MSRRVLVLVVLLAPRPAHAGDTGHAVAGTVKEAARTAGHAARDGALTFGRSVGAFFHGGAHAARDAWAENAARTKADAKAGARATKRAARGE